MSDSSADVAKVAELIRDFRFAMVTTVNTLGELVARPMTVQEAEFDGDLWFIAARDSHEIAELDVNPVAGVSFASNDTWVSLTGTAKQVDDPARLAEYWNPWVEAWFPDGPEDPNVTLVKFTASGAEYWDSPGGRIASAVNFVKSKLTGSTADVSENAKVDLD
jgi:general stress protein 26